MPTIHGGRGRTRPMKLRVLATLNANTKSYLSARGAGPDVGPTKTAEQNVLISRREKLYARLRSEEAELRTLLAASLRMVADGRNRMFFTTIGGVPTAAGEPVLTRARGIIDLANQVGEPQSEPLAAAVLDAFEAANDRTNEHRLGWIRLARELLKQPGEA